MQGLADLLSRESELVRDFIASLESEQEALKKGQTDPLPALGVRKAELVDRLNAAEAARNSFLQQSGHAGDREGMAAWLAANPRDRTTAGLWAKLVELAGEARRTNEINGRLIALRLQATNQALSALNQEAQRSSLYGRDGLSTSRTGSRIIDAA